MNVQATAFAVIALLIFLAIVREWRDVRRSWRARQIAAMQDDRGLVARESEPSHRPMSRERAKAIALAEEDADIDAAIRRQSELHGRTHVHAGERRASMEASAAAIRETMAQGSNGPYEG